MMLLLPCIVGFVLQYSSSNVSSFSVTTTLPLRRNHNEGVVIGFGGVSIVSNKGTERRATRNTRLYAKPSFSKIHSKSSTTATSAVSTTQQTKNGISNAYVTTTGGGDNNNDNEITSNYDYLASLEKAMQTKGIKQKQHLLSMKNQRDSPAPLQTINVDAERIITSVVVDVDVDVDVVEDTKKITSTNILGVDDVVFARILLLTAAALYGTNFSFVKILGTMDIPVGISSTLRFGLAALATSPWLFVASKERKEQQQQQIQQQMNQDNFVVSQQSTIESFTDGSNYETTSVVPRTGGILQDFLTSKNMWSYELGATLAGMEVGLWNSMAYVAQAVGLGTTLASKSAFLCSLSVVIVPLLDRMTGKKLQTKQLIGIAAALAGVGFLELGDLSATDLTLTPGDIASLMQPLAFGMGFWRMESAMKHYPDEANRSTASQLLAVFLGSVIFTMITDPSSFNIEAISNWLQNPLIVQSLIWTGMVSTALTVYMETLALKSISAAETTLILSTEPLWGSAFAAFIMGETFGIDAAIGGILILFACVYSSLGQKGIVEFLTRNNNDKTKEA